MTLTAQWKANTYKVTVNTAGGSAAPTVADQTFDGAAFSLSAPTKTGYIFGGWKLTGNADYNTAKYGTTSSPSTAIGTDTVCAGSTVYFKNLSSTGGTVTLTAQWTAIRYNVTVKYGNGQADTTRTGESFDGAAFSLTAPAKTGYTFGGWQLTGDADYNTAKYGTSASDVSKSIASAQTVCAGSTVYFKNLSSTNGASVVLTAKWTGNKYLLVYHPNFTYSVDTDIEVVGDWAWSDTSYGEGAFTAESGYNTVYSAYLDDENYFYLHTETETRFALGWTLTKDSTTVDFDFYTADGGSVSVTYDDLIAKSGVIENAVYDSTYDAYVIDLYAVWSANYADLEAAVGTFQNKYMRFEDPDADVVIRDAFHRDAPTYAVLPAVGSSDAQYKYHVTCEKCGHVYRYARMCSTIKAVQAHTARCSCGSRNFKIIVRK